MEQIAVFESTQFGKIRTIKINDIPWFSGKDIAKCLGYSNPQKAIRAHVREEDRTVNESFTVNGTQVALINESGLYSLILSSKMENAQKFKAWVTSEVLPSINKNGVYVLGQENMSRDELLAKLEEVTEKVKAQELLIEQQKDAVEFANSIIAGTGEIDVGTMAKILTQTGFKIGRTGLFRFLRDKGYLSSKNVPQQKYMESGYFTLRVKEVKAAGKVLTSIYTPMITPKGQAYIAGKFKKIDGEQNVHRGLVAQ